MRWLLLISTVLSLLTTGYCFFEYQMPHAQLSKVLSELKLAGVNDPERVDRIRWAILGVQTTWKPLLALASVESILMVGLTVYVWTSKRKPLATVDSLEVR
jgi:hypothetical protein